MEFVREQSTVRVVKKLIIYDCINVQLKSFNTKYKLGTSSLSLYLLIAPAQKKKTLYQDVLDTSKMHHNY